MVRICRTFLTAISGLVLIAGTGCNSSHDLLYPQSHKLAQHKGNIRFIEDMDMSPSASRQIKVVAGDKMAPAPIPDELLNKYAGMIGLMPRSMSNYILYKFIDDWYGVKYT